MQMPETEHGKNMSLPLWERGLKSYTRYDIVSYARSLPLWERGLKSFGAVKTYSGELVAPFVGAWIEI